MAEDHRDLADVAYLIVASWLLGTRDERIPTSGGVLDRALYKVRDRLPSWAQRQLHFTTLRTGLRCSELPQILDFAQTSLLTVAPNPTYHHARIQVSEWNARDWLQELSIEEPQAQQLGQALKAETDHAMTEGR